MLSLKQRMRREGEDASQEYHVSLKQAEEKKENTTWSCKYGK